MKSKEGMGQKEKIRVYALGVRGKIFCGNGFLDCIERSIKFFHMVCPKRSVQGKIYSPAKEFHESFQGLKSVDVLEKIRVSTKGLKGIFESDLAVFKSLGFEKTGMQVFCCLRHCLRHHTFFMTSGSTEWYMAETVKIDWEKEYEQYGTSKVFCE